MRKTIYFLLTALVLNLCNCYGAFGGTPHEISMINTFFHYGGGTPHLNLDGIREYSGGRAFVTNIEVQKGDLKLRVQPTWKNYKYDIDLANRQAAGIRNIWTFQGKLDYQITQGKTGKVNPINDADDPMLESSWADYGELVKQVVIRYADDTQPFLSQANVYTASDYTNNIPKAGLGLLWAVADRNEADFPHKWSEGKRTLNQKQNAVGFKVFYESVRSVSKTMRIIMPSNIRPDVDSIQTFLVTLQNLYASAGKDMPRDFYLDFHWYMRNSSQNQTGGTWGATPEFVKAYEHGLRMDSLVEAWGLLGWLCTETGWSTYTGIMDNGQSNGDPSMFKQNAPTLQGYDIYHAQGILMERLTLIWGSLKHCKGIAYWMCRNNYDVGPYYAGGINYSNWSPKTGRLLYRDFLTTYGNHDIQNFRQKDQLYAVDLIASTDTVTLVWTDQNKFGEYDAKPRIGTLELPNQSPTVTLTEPNGDVFVAPADVTISVNATDADGYVTRVEFYQGGNLLFTDTQYPYTHTITGMQAGTYTFSVKAYDNNNLSTTINNIEVEVNAPQPTTTGLTVVNNRLHLNGQPYKINEANSPESRLRDLNYAELDQLAQCGINTIYCTLFGGDITSIHPFINLSAPSQGFDDARVNQWVAYFQYWLNKSPNNILHLLLSEKENHYDLSETNHKAMISYFANKFRAFEGRIIYDREELDEGKQSYINTYYSYLKQVAPKSIRGMHNNTNENPWAGFENSDLIQFLSLQEWSGNFDRRIRQLFSVGGWAVYASEVTGGIQTHPSCSTLVQTLVTAGGENSSGAGYFISSKDHSFPNFQSQYCGCYQYGASLLGQQPGNGGGGNPPPATTYPLHYSTTSNISNGQPLQGATLNAGKIWAYVNTSTDIPNRPLKFYYDNNLINQESGRPYELGGGNGYTVTDGQHTVKVVNSQGAEISTATFTVGNIVIPPDTIVPPDTTTANFIVEYSTRWDRTQAETISGNQVTLPSTSYWFFVREGTGTFTFDMLKAGVRVRNFPREDETAPYDFNNGSNLWLQSGVEYTLTITNGTAIRTITINVQ